MKQQENTIMVLIAIAFAMMVILPSVIVSPAEAAVAEPFKPGEGPSRPCTGGTIYSACTYN